MTTASLFGAEVISDDDYGSYAVGFEEPAEDAPPAPARRTAHQPGMIGTMFDGTWQTPQQAPTMMECVSGTCQDCCCPRGGWVGGAGVYVIKPHWTTNPAFATTVTNGAVNIDSQTDFPYSYYATPLVWFGYVGENGLGARTRFWLFNQSSTIHRTNDGNVTYISAAPLNYLNSSSTAGDVLTFNSGLKVNVVDFELTQTFQLGAFTGQLSAGGRYTRIQQSYYHVESPLTTLDDIVDSSQAFNGFGPSLGAEVKRSLMDSGFSLYANGRGSLLFGKSSQQATNINNNAITNVGSFSNWDVVPTMETELGILWERDTDRGRLFLDAGVVGIAFFGAGNAANNQILLNSTDDQADKNATLGFFGFKFAAGMSY
ncbi:MAG: hypothetical protein K8R36_21470 [Planctomycetales bacterium]|nr:hypothetical protein [Planctomycetales bacterium]